MTISLKHTFFLPAIIWHRVSLDLRYGVFYRELGETLAELIFRADPEAISYRKERCFCQAAKDARRCKQFAEARRWDKTYIKVRESRQPRRTDGLTPIKLMQSSNSGIRQERPPALLGCG